MKRAVLILTLALLFAFPAAASNVPPGGGGLNPCYRVAHGTLVYIWVGNVLVSYPCP